MSTPDVKSRFHSRRDAGRQLSQHVARLVKGDRVTVVALQPGGIPIGYEVARLLHAPLELLRRDGRPLPALTGRTVVLVDDGLATTSTMHEAVKRVRELGAARIIVAAPISSPDASAIIRAEADDCTCVISHFPLHGVQEWYDDFAQPSDDEVLTLLAANTSWIANRTNAALEPELTW